MSTLQPQGPPQSGHTSHTEKASASMETNPHQQSPEYTQHTPKTITHGEQALSHPPVHTTPTHQCPAARSGQRYAKAAYTNKHRGAKPTSQSSVHTGRRDSKMRVLMQTTTFWALLLRANAVDEN